jgi:hypothetical protein
MLYHEMGKKKQLFDRQCREPYNENDFQFMFDWA